jgi:hypothetical protein
LSSDFGALLLRGIDRQIGLTERLAAAVQNKRQFCRKICFAAYLEYDLAFS